MTLLTLILYFFLLHASQTFGNKPHIIVIIADDMGRNDVSYHGSNQIPTPNIDSLAYNGIIMDRFYTQAMCTPSRAAFLTGTYPVRSGMQGYPLKAGENRSLPLNTPTMSEQLKKLGYKTHLVGKWHLGAAHRKNTPIGRGFDTHFGYWSGLIGYFDYVSFTNLPNGTRIKGLDIHDKLKPVWSAQGKYATDLFTEKTIKILDRHDPQEPIFLVLSHLAPHSGKDGVELGVPNVTLTNIKYPYIKSQRRRLYADVVNLMDKSVGTVMKKLSQKNMLSNSIVLFFSDNGGETVGLYENSASNWPLRGVKFVDFEGGIRTAAAIYSPLFKKRSYVNKELIHLTDWLPTFYSAAGGDLVDLGEIDGINQWDILSENKKTSRSEILININNEENSSAIITDNGKYKFIKAGTKDGILEKYHGESGRGAEVPPYNYQTIFHSLTNLAIKNITKDTLTKEKIDYLRSATDLSWCRRSHVTPDLTCTEGCLFDLVKDPCETTNIKVLKNKISEKLQRKLEEYQQIVKPLANRPYDINSDPIFYNNTWCTWLDDEICFKTSNIERIK